MLAVLYLLLGTWFLWVLTGIFRDKVYPEKRKVVFILGRHDGSVEFLLRRLYRCPGINRTSYEFQVNGNSPDRTNRIIEMYRRYCGNITLVAPGNSREITDDNHGRCAIYDLSGLSNKQLITLTLTGKLC